MNESQERFQSQERLRTQLVQEYGIPEEKAIKAIDGGATTVQQAIDAIFDTPMNEPTSTANDIVASNWTPGPTAMDTGGGWDVPGDQTDSNVIALPDANATGGFSVGQSGAEPIVADALVSMATNEEEEQLKKAIELSRIEAEKVKSKPGFTHVEDESIQRAIQASLIDFDPTAARDGNTSMMWKQPIPDDLKERRRLRESDWVGLRNIGNTCYLNSLLQVYFHLSEFRRKVFSFRTRSPEGQSQKNHPSGNTNSNGPTKSEASGISQDAASKFVEELQRLFAEMALSNVRFVDPSRVIEALRGPNGQPIEIGGQQDVSEFNQIFLDMVEKAFADNLGEHGCEPGTNFVKDLFTFDFLQEVAGSESSEDPDRLFISSKGETNSFIVDATSAISGDIYDGLDDYTKATIDYRRDNGNTVKATKSVWLTKVAPVLTVYLQRVQYNRDTNVAEKVHRQFNFVEQLCVDRYRSENRKMAEIARSLVDRLKRQRAESEAIREQYIYYGRRGEHGRNADENINNAVKIQDAMSTAYTRTIQRLESIQAEDNFNALNKKLNLTADELNRMSSILQGIAAQDSEEIRNLSNRILSLQDQEKHAYDRIDCVTNYILFAVLVHDGAPTGGHYWAFIRQPGSSEWARFSDLMVTSISSEEMWRAALGGQNAASAYALIYAQEPDQTNRPMYESMIAEEGRKLLPAGVVMEIEKTNDAFTAELEMQSRRERPKMILKATMDKLSSVRSSAPPGFDIAIFCLKIGLQRHAVFRVLCETFGLQYSTNPSMTCPESFFDLTRKSLEVDVEEQSVSNEMDDLQREVLRELERSTDVSPELKSLAQIGTNASEFDKFCQDLHTVAKLFSFFTRSLVISTAAYRATMGGDFEQACYLWIYNVNRGFIESNEGFEDVPLSQIMRLSNPAYLENFEKSWVSELCFAALCVFFEAMIPFMTTGDVKKFQVLLKIKDSGALSRECLDLMVNNMQTSITGLGSGDERYKKGTTLCRAFGAQTRRLPVLREVPNIDERIHASLRQVREETVCGTSCMTSYSTQFLANIWDQFESAYGSYSRRTPLSLSLNDRAREFVRDIKSRQTGE